MPMFLLIVFLTGALLGMRFKVLILLPAVGLAGIGFFWVGTLRGGGASAILLPATLAWAGLQLGYLCGSATRYSFQLGRRPPKGLLQAKEPSQAN
jgi:hypothetical protein